MAADIIPFGHISIDHAEYERLQRNSRKLQAIRDRWDQYHMEKKLAAEGISEDHMHKIRRRALNEIGEILRRKDVKRGS